jgi:hypothetical protein
VVDSHRSEYKGFTVNEATREYTLRVTTLGAEARDFTVAIPNHAFLARLVRYQDAPGICFLKLQRELALCPDLAAARLTVTDAELEEYRVANAPPPSKPRPKYPVPSSEPASAG